MCKTFTDDELAVLDAVVTEIGCNRPLVLRDTMHGEAPWRDTRDTIPDDETSDSPIDESDIAAFFMGLRQRYGMEQPGDIGRYMSEAVERA